MIYLRPLLLSDYVLINKWRNDPDMAKFLGGNMFLFSLDREKKWIEEKIFNDSKNLYFGICVENSDQLIGYTSINNLDLRNLKAEWGGTIIGNKEYLGKGLGRRAAILMLKYLFDQYPINKCYASCLQEHPSSVKLFSGIGFRQDGIIRDDVFKNGEFKTSLLFSILRKEFYEKL